MGKHRTSIAPRSIGSKYTTHVGTAINRNQKKERNKYASRYSSGEIVEEDDARLVSIIERDDVQELVLRAQMMGEEFKPSRRRVVDSELLAREAVEVQEEQREQMKRSQRFVSIPRRPLWDPANPRSPEEQKKLEEEAFIRWRSTLSGLEQRENKLVLTPYEHNITIWRQLWRVVERSDIVMQIVDARDPLLYWCTDLDRFTQEVSYSQLMRKRTVLLLNKADLLSDELRLAWSSWFKKAGISALFYSATATASDASPGAGSGPLLTPAQLIDTFESYRKEWLAMPEHAQRDWTKRPFTVGFCGFPNVGKSSCVNSLLKFVGSQGRVAVGATPGKTKHFQTHYLDKDKLLQLADCPGLVFPALGISREALIAAGIIGVDQVRSGQAAVAAVSVVASRIPADILGAFYGIALSIEDIEGAHASENPDTALDKVFADAGELIEAVGISKGFRVDKGLVDPHRSSLVLLRDYQKGMITFCTPPPDLPDLTVTQRPAEVAENAERSKATTSPSEIARVSIMAEAARAVRCTVIISRVLIDQETSAVHGQRTGPYRQPWREMLIRAGRIDSGADFSEALQEANASALQQAIAQAQNVGADPSQRRGYKAVREARQRKFIPMKPVGDVAIEAPDLYFDSRPTQGQNGVLTIQARGEDASTHVPDRLATRTEIRAVMAERHDEGSDNDDSDDYVL